MGNCASPQYTKKVGGGGGGLNWPSTAKIIHVDGRLQEFRQPIKASHILSLNPKSFLCSSESMYIDCHLPQVPDDEELQLGQLYFLVPLSKSNVPLSLQELCALASKASASLAQSDSMGFTPNKTILPYSDRSDPKILATDEWCCKIPVALTQSANWLPKSQN
ncbi:hypothetical protein POPTR_009G110700v4 [Populus trichocarpa]|jgi:hypothetical protein|uniref:DUF4228 domain-containing protein n=1 Tax=Populus trichocarpa TaxID=3694 RepID=B9HRT2_POPTR|nr:hypothetical protein BDE02_09G097200 [Populus trichocarpa]PNT20750.1 hypothetical protein POPTR_009G110700v4 [Populus trichocarpa]|eukprot:XP_002313818.1 uncharacterized protein LOC7456404 [Populus trichocarpa]